MAIDEPIAQIVKILEIKKNILLVIKASPSLDQLSAALALAKILGKKGKQADLVIEKNPATGWQAYAWLPHFEKIKHYPKKEAKIGVAFLLGGQEINGLTYKVADDKLLINVFPEKENFRLNQPLITHGSYPYDLVAAIGAPDLESLGKIYQENAELFYNTPVINIDCRENNEHFGQLNLVDLSSVGVCETIFKLLERWQKNLLDQDIATCLLAGIIAESRTWQNPHLTPHSLAVASELISAGGRRELVVEKLYSNKSIATLQIWGRTLANLKTEPEHELVWSRIGQNDFEQTSTEPSALQSVIDDLLGRVPQAKCVFVVYEWRSSRHAFVYTNRPGADLRKILSPLGAAGAGNLVEINLADLNIEESIALLKETIISRWPAGLPRF